MAKPPLPSCCLFLHLIMNTRHKCSVELRIKTWLFTWIYGNDRCIIMITALYTAGINLWWAHNYHRNAAYYMMKTAACSALVIWDEIREAAPFNSTKRHLFWDYCIIEAFSIIPNRLNALIYGKSPHVGEKIFSSDKKFSWNRRTLWLFAKTYNNFYSANEVGDSC